MPITLAKMAARTASVTFQYDDENVTVIYSPGKVNDEMIAQLDGDSTTLTQALASIIKSWDVYEDIEQTMMFPLDAVRMKELEWPFRMRVRQEIVRDMRPN